MIAVPAWWVASAALRHDRDRESTPAQGQIIRLLKQVRGDLLTMPKFVTRDARASDRQQVRFALREARARKFCQVSESVGQIDYAGRARRPLNGLRRALGKLARRCRISTRSARTGRVGRAHFTPVMPGIKAPDEADVEQGDIPPTPIGPPVGGRRNPGSPVNSGPATLHGPRQALARAASAGDPVAIHQKSEIAGLPAPPVVANDKLDGSIAAAGQVVLMAGNGFIAVSTNYGNTFKYLYAYANANHNGIIGPDSVDGGGQQDQILQYDPHTRRFFWLIQNFCAIGGTAADCGKANSVDRERLLWASYDDVLRSGGTAGWSFVDITPQMLGLPGTWFDYPDVSLNDHYLYMTFDAMHPPDPCGPKSAVWGRFSLDALANARPGSQQWFHWGYFCHQVLLRPVQGGRGDTGYVVHQQSDSAFDLYVMHPPAPQGDDGLAAKTVTHEQTPDESQCDEPTADGLDFLLAGGAGCGEPTDHVGGAAFSGDGQLWVAWTSGQRLHDKTELMYRHAHIEVSTIADVNGTPHTVSQRAIYNDNYAFAYPSLSTGPSGEVAMTYLTGGPSRYPTLGVGFLTGRESFRNVAASTNGCQRMGDFLGVRPLAGKPGLFVATGVMVSGYCSGGNSQSHHPWYAVFGRRSDVTPRYSSSLTVGCQSYAHPGDALRVTGALQPGLANRTVTLTYTTPAGASVQQTATTGPGGAYSGVIETSPDELGPYTVTVSWPGDFDNAASTGGPCSTYVQPVVTGLIPSSVTINCQSVVSPSVAIDGFVNPPRAGSVELSGQSADAGASFNDQAAIDPLTGAYHDTHAIGWGPYHWTVQAHVEGDAVYSEANASCSFTGSPSPPPK